MSSNKQGKFACLAQAAAAVAVLQFFALHSNCASAQVGAQTAAQISAVAQPPPARPIAAPGATLPAIPAVAGSNASAKPIVETTPATCTAPAELARFDRPLVHTMRRLANGQPLTIVAIGSSSTAGAGASSPDASYPSRLAVDLRTRFPGREITVLNRGVNGEETNNMMVRFATDVLAARPQLVLWQIGTNSVLRDHPLNPHAVQLHEGIEQLKAAGADVVLIDPQFAPRVIAKSETLDMVEQIAVAAKEANVELFRRFALMQSWHDVQHIPFDTFVAPDGLHMNDWSYACLAKLLSGAIAEAATRPLASAAHAAPAR